MQNTSHTIISAEIHCQKIGSIENLLTTILGREYYYPKFMITVVEIRQPLLRNASLSPEVSKSVFWIHSRHFWKGQIIIFIRSWRINLCGISGYMSSKCVLVGIMHLWGKPLMKETRGQCCGYWTLVLLCMPPPSHRHKQTFLFSITLLP